MLYSIFDTLAHTDNIVLLAAFQPARKLIQGVQSQTVLNSTLIRLYQPNFVIILISLLLPSLLVVIHSHFPCRLFTLATFLHMTLGMAGDVLPMTRNMSTHLPGLSRILLLKSSPYLFDRIVFLINGRAQWNLAPKLKWASRIWNQWTYLESCPLFTPSRSSTRF